jgi:hypothetical protein
MGLGKEDKFKKQDLKTGVHLVTILDATLIKGPDKKPKMFIRGDKKEVGIIIKFSNAKGAIYENTYYVGADRAFYFNTMCSHAGINLVEANKNNAFKKEAKGKRLWIFINEIHDVNLENPVLHDITGEPIINYYLFKTAACNNPENRPILLGDPHNNKGIVGGEFIDYRQVEISNNVKVESNDEFTMPIITETVQTKTGEVKSNKAFKEQYTAMEKNQNFLNEVPEVKEKSDDIDFSDF